MSALTKLKDKALGSQTKRNTVFAMGAEIAQLALSMAAFFLLYHTLDADGYGLYTAALAHGLLAATIGYFGSQQLLMRDFALGRPFQVLWSRLLSTVLAGTVLFVPVLLLARSTILGQSADDITPFTYLLLVVSQILLFGLTDFAVLAAQAHRRLEVAMSVRLSSGTIRLIGVVAFYVFGNGTLAQWAIVGLVAWGAAAAWALMTVKRSFGASPTLGTFSKQDIRDGLPYTLMGGANTMLDSLDKSMIPAYGFKEEAGWYAAGYRIAALAVVPVMAVVRATDQDFFSAGARSLDEAFALAKKLVRPVILFGIVAGIGLLVFAPIFPWIVRDSSGQMATVIRWLAVLPLIRGISIFPANALTGANRQGLRNALIVMAMVINFSINVWLIPQYNWKGAVIATLVAETLSATGMWLALLYLVRKDRRIDELEAELIEEYGQPERRR